MYSSYNEAKWHVKFCMTFSLNLLILDKANLGCNNDFFYANSIHKDYQ